MKTVEEKIGNTSFSINYDDTKTTAKITKKNGEAIFVFSSFSTENPIIPNGFKYVEGMASNGFVIENEFGDQFVWVPVDEPLDELKFEEKLMGINNFSKLKKLPLESKLTFSKHVKSVKKNVRELKKIPLESTVDFLKQVKSVKKYGGFYVARYMTSVCYEIPSSVVGKKVRTFINYNEALELAEIMTRKFKDCEISAHVIYGKEYDAILKWILESGAKSRFEVIEDCSSWGNCNKRWCQYKTGSREEYYANKIDGLAGNAATWTQEKTKNNKRIIRGVEAEVYRMSDCTALKCTTAFESEYFGGVGVRMALYIE